MYKKFLPGPGPNRFNLIEWIKNHLANQNLFFFDFWFTLANHFRSEGIAVIHFDSLWFSILILFDFDSSRITIHPRIMIHLKITWRWIVIHSFANHWLVRFRIKSESKWKANQAGLSPGSWRNIKIIYKNLWYVIEVLALMNKGRVGQTNSVE